MYDQYRGAWCELVLEVRNHARCGRSCFRLTIRISAYVHYLSLTLFFLGGALAISIRTELFLPGAQLFEDANTFNRVFTVHGTTMLFLWVIPLCRWRQLLIPIMVRYKDMAWLLNAVASSDDTSRLPGMAWLCRHDLECLPSLFYLASTGPIAEMDIWAKDLGISSILGSINFLCYYLEDEASWSAHD